MPCMWWILHNRSTFFGSCLCNSHRTVNVIAWLCEPQYEQGGENESFADFFPATRLQLSLNCPSYDIFQNFSSLVTNHLNIQNSKWDNQVMELKKSEESVSESGLRMLHFHLSFQQFLLLKCLPQKHCNGCILALDLAYRNSNVYWQIRCHKIMMQPNNLVA